jgi:hypothetical protein
LRTIIGVVVEVPRARAGEPVERHRPPVFVEDVEHRHRLAAGHRLERLARLDPQQLDGGVVGVDEPPVGGAHRHGVEHPLDDRLEALLRVEQLGAQARVLERQRDPRGEHLGEAQVRARSADPTSRPPCAAGRPGARARATARSPPSAARATPADRARRRPAPRCGACRP